MGDGRIFLKIRRDASFNKDLANEPNFDGIHLAGQYLKQLALELSIIISFRTTNLLLLLSSCKA
jgi:hypothetical protein